MTPDRLERAAIAAYCAFWQQYDDGTVHHPGGKRMTPRQAWDETSEPQRQMSRMIAATVIRAMQE